MKKIRKGRMVYEGFEFAITAVYDEADELLVPWDADAELAIVGNPIPRIDGAKRLSGAARYTVDVQLPRMLHAAVLRSTVANGRVEHLDLEAARAAPGVRAVVGPEDSIGSAPSPLTATPEYVGAPIAAVAAETLAQARAALVLLAPQVDALPFEVDLEAALRAQRFTNEPTEHVRGEADALGGGDVQIEFELETGFHVQTPLEPHAAVADWQDDELTVWTSTQGIFSVRGELAARFELPSTRVRVIAEFVGGGFGCKIAAGTEAVLATELSRRARRPVSLVFSRHEEQLTGGHRAATRQSVRLAATRDGTLVASEFDAVIGMGSAGHMVPPVHGPAMFAYKTANAHAMRFPVKLNVLPVNAFRGPGYVEGTTGYEQAVDELANALAIDPLELRRRMHVDHDQGSGKLYSGKSLLVCYDRAAALSGWAGRDRLRDEHAADGLLRGLGCATQMWFGSAGPAAECSIRIGADGIATVVTGIQDIGTGTFTTAQMVAAEELGLPLDRVRVVGGDTRPNIQGPASGGSVTTASVTPAVRAAAASVRRALLDLAGDTFEISPDDLTLSGGRIQSRDHAFDCSYTELTDTFGQATVEGTGARTINSEEFAIHTWGCQIAQVAVDPGLGSVIVEHIWAVHDVGRIINPLAASSQVEGGVLQGVGYALTEERVIDRTTGVPTNATLDDYKVPTIADTPAIVVEFIGVPDPVASNTAAKGLGEPPIIPTAAAIANAFAHATGRRPHALPLTPARVLEVLA